MLKWRHALPLDYSLCRDRVCVEGRVLEGVYFEGRESLDQELGRQTLRRGFLLVVPGDCAIAPGDTVGHAGTDYVAASVQRQYLQGRLCHTEIRG